MLMISVEFPEMMMILEECSEMLMILEEFPGMMMIPNTRVPWDRKTTKATHNPISRNTIHLTMNNPQTQFHKQKNPAQDRLSF